MSARQYSYRDGDVIREAVEPDMASELDKPAEVMAEKFGIPLGAAMGIQADFDRELEHEVVAQVASRTMAIIGYLIAPSKNLQAKVMGLAFSQGLAGPLNGLRNMNDVAKQKGCTRALISYYKRAADVLLGSEVRIFGKSAKARVSYQTTRVAVVHRNYEPYRLDGVAE